MSHPELTTEIRPMTVADLDAVLNLAARLPGAPHWPRSAYLDALNSELTPRRIALVAVTSDSIVGLAIARLLPPQAELETIAIVAGSQRRGLGRRLFYDLAHRLREAGVCELLLEVRSSNLPALAFYCSLGLTRSGLRGSYYTDPVEDAVLMRLPLL